MHPTLTSWLCPSWSCLPTEPWKPSCPDLPTTDAWQTLKVVFRYRFDGENKAVFDGEVIHPFCIQLEPSHGGSVDASFRNLYKPGAEEKKAKKIPLNWLLGMHSSPMILGISKLGLKLCWSIHSFPSPPPPMWCCFPNSKSTELFWLALILIFCAPVILQSCSDDFHILYLSIPSIIMPLLCSDINTRSHRKWKIKDIIVIQ